MIRNRKLNRLNNYDYSRDGCYFIRLRAEDPVCKHGDECGQPALRRMFAQEYSADNPPKLKAKALQRRRVFQGTTPVKAWGSITMCTKNRVAWFGEIRNDEMVLNEWGKIVTLSWDDLPNHYKNIRLDQFIVMPNHMHGIVIIDNVGNGLKPFPTSRNHGLSEIIRGLKTFSSRKINEKIGNGEKFQWQKSFYDHIIRKETDLNRIRQYVADNPCEWPNDRNNPMVLSRGITPKGSDPDFTESRKGLTLR